jgi:hypothetical protein
MDGTILVGMGGFVLLLWLCVAFFDRIQGWRAPWHRWARVRPTMVPVLRVLAIGLAVVVSLCYALMLAAAVAAVAAG